MGIHHTGVRKLKRNPTSSDRRNLMTHIRRAMSGELAKALQICQNMGPADAAKAELLIADLGAIKRHIEDRAALLGYSERCRQAIAVCRGECCRWHFPRTINRVDFLIAVFQQSADANAALIDQVQPGGDRAYQCPLLLKDGCIFTFATRPVVCTTAFPCFAGADYWQFKESYRKDIDAIREALGQLVDESVDGHA